MYTPTKTWLLGMLFVALTSCGHNERSLPGPVEPTPPKEEPKPDPKPEPPVPGHIIAEVLSYTPAPGQFVNKLPRWEEGNTRAQMNAKALEHLRKNEVITLGGFGGYITIRLSQRIPNKAGNDLRILGNAFNTDSSLLPKDFVGKATSSEPGIVEVAYDANGNGLPDANEWYELAGSQYKAASTIHRYSIRYYKPSANHEPTPPTEASDAHLSDTKYIRWQDNQGGEGYLPQNVFHDQSYYPLWITDDSYSLSGTRLESNVSLMTSGSGLNLWIGKALLWGYVDDVPNDEEGSTFDISWAVRPDGTPVKDLPGIDFIRIYTGVHALAGPIGEISTEVSGIEVL